MRPYQLDVTNFAEEGSNRLSTEITNTLSNRVSVLAKSDPVLPGLVEHFGKDPLESDDDKLSIIPKIDKVVRPEVGFRPLALSGLLGPIRLIPMKRAEVILK